MAKAIFATDESYGFGYNNQLPWKIPSELAHFKIQTDNSVLIMGKNTWDTLPKKTISKTRVCIIITHQTQKSLYNEHYVKSLEGALSAAFLYNKSCFIIGGKQILSQAFQSEYIERIIWSQIKGNYKADVILDDLTLWLEGFTLLNKFDYPEFNVFEYEKM